MISVELLRTKGEVFQDLLRMTNNIGANLYFFYDTLTQAVKDLLRSKQLKRAKHPRL